MVKHNLDNYFQAVNAKTHRGTLPPTVALHVTIIGSEASYMKEASKMYGVMLKIADLYPWIDSQSVVKFFPILM